MVTEVDSVTPSLQRQPLRDSSYGITSLHDNLPKHNGQYHDSDVPSDIQFTIEDAGGWSRSSSPCSIINGPPHLEALDASDIPFPSTTSTDGVAHPIHVHFRPRVRITSGIGRYRHQHSPLSPSSTDRALISCTPGSSISGSPSSSISVPLRSRTDDEADSSGWGPLGKRVGLLSRKHSRDRRRKIYHDSYIDASERTPLLHPHYQPYSQGEYTSDQGSLDSEVTRRAHEFDHIFGTWPYRLLNRHWWWWHVEPIVCCHCMDDSDIE